MSKIENPFYYGGVAEKAYFCNRATEIETIKKDINNGLNLLLYAPRRFGKTSLVLKALNETENNYIFVDLMSVTDESEFINTYFDAISKSLASTAEKTVRYFKNVLNLKPNINVNFDMNGTPSYSLNFGTKDKAPVLSEILDLPYKYAKADGKKPVVVFDEFQEIEKMKIEDKLRSSIQRHGNRVSYIFMGSKKSIMERLFFSRNSAFYKSVKHLPIGGISMSEWTSFIKNGFENSGKIISNRFIEKIFKITKGFPYYTQQISYELFNLCGHKVDSEVFNQTIKYILDREEDLFLLEWGNLSLNQKKALKLVIKAKGKNIYNQTLMNTFGMNNSSLKKAVEGLVKKDVLDKTGSGYYLQDPMFEYYMRLKQQD